MKLKTNDTVIVLSGKDQGKKGRISRLFSQENKVLIDGLNTYQKHVKAQGDQKKGGLVTLSRPLHISKLALICPHCQKPTRVGYQGFKKDKVRVCKKCGQPLSQP